MNLDEIRKALRELPPDQLRTLLEEFAPYVASGQPTREDILDIAKGVIKDRKDLLQRLADK